MAANRPCSVRILTRLASLESWHSQLSNDTKIITNRPISFHGHVLIFEDFSHFFNVQKMPKINDFQLKNMPKMTKI